jgi:hypothetical protein
LRPSFPGQQMHPPLVSHAFHLDLIHGLKGVIIQADSTREQPTFSTTGFTGFSTNATSVGPAPGSLTPVLELEAALDWLRANERRFLSYMILGAVDRRTGGQGIVQFSTGGAGGLQQFAIKFFLDRAAFGRERELYSIPEFRKLMPTAFEVCAPRTSRQRCVTCGPANSFFS